MSFSTSDLHDAQPDVVGIVEAQFRSFGKRIAFSGPCFTIKVHEDHSRIRELAGTPGKGQVMVIDGGGSLRIGLMGDMLAERAMKNGWAGAVIFGAIRDSAAIDALDFGVKALGTTARRGNDDLGGKTGIPVAFGGVVFRPGCWVYADADAVLMAPQQLPEG